MAQNQNDRPLPSDAFLDERQWVADPHADDTVAAIDDLNVAIRVAAAHPLPCAARRARA